jgi:hypothetical protein
MKAQRHQQPDPSAAQRLWTFEAALRAVPYIRAVVQSVREDWLLLQALRRQIERLDSRPGRPDRQTLSRRAVAVEELRRADIELEKTLNELDAIDTYCLDPVQGLALIPFSKGDDLAWYVFDVFSSRGLEAWRFHGDPLGQAAAAGARRRLEKKGNWP